MRVKSCTMAVKAAGTQDGTDDGVFEALVATYDLDSFGDKIIPGAFKTTLDTWKAKGDPLPVIWSHMSYDPEAHIGWVLDAEERDNEGLWVKAQLDLEEPMAARVYKLLKGRRVTQFSFAYDVLEGAWIEKSDEPSYYELRQLDLFEVGPCLLGVNQETELLDVKGRDGRDVRLRLEGSVPHDADTIRLAVETALGVAGGGKAGRVLSAKNEQSLKDALDKFSDGVKDVKTVLAALSSTTEDDAEKSAEPGAGQPAPGNSTDEHEATPGQRAEVEEPPGAKTSQPARHAPASLRLRTDLAAFAAEVDSLT